MKNILVSISIICFFASCQFKSGSGNIITQTRNTGNFSGVNVGGAFEVEIKIGESTKVIVEADDNVMEDIETRIDNNQLKISIRDGVSYNNVHMKIFITAPAINKISSSAAAEVDVKDVLASDNKITFNASSGSSIKSAVNAPNIEADASSGGQIDLNGRTKNFDLEASSGGSIDAFELFSENTTVQTSSGGNVDVHASVQLDAKASSGGHVSYRGAATVIKKESSGGSIEKND